jgi:cyclopropane fatty-acyl-phospholipid synthase-like methyltransferase
MLKRLVTTCGLLWALSLSVVGQQTALTDDQIRTADAEVPRLAELLELKPGMAVADVGAGFGAWSMRLARWLGPNGRVYATDVGAAQLASMRASMEREQLPTVTVIEGGLAASNLPPACCDAILVRDAFHHFTQPQAMIQSLVTSLKPGGRLAIIDFPPRPNSEAPAGVPADRGGHGVPIAVVEREVGGQLSHVRTIADWSSSGNQLFLVLFRKP